MLTILEKLLLNTNINEISTNLNISPGTVKRWVENKNVPNSYCFELMKLSNITIDYSKFTSKEKDQFFTPTKISKQCYTLAKKIIKKYENKISDYIYIEPSAGDGSFLKILPKKKKNWIRY